MTHPEVASKRVTRTPTKPKKGTPHRLHLIVDGGLVELIDRVAAEMTKAEPFASSPKTRTDAIKVLLVEALRARGMVK